MKGPRYRRESQVVDVKPLVKSDGSEGYEVMWEESTALFFKKSGKYTSKGIIFSGGVLGTVKLLLKFKKSSLPKLSNKIGNMVRTNSEALMPVTAMDKKTDYSKGVAIGSILHIGEHSHLGPVRYSKGSGIWRLMMLPRV